MLEGGKKLFGVKTTCEYSILNILHYDLNLHQRSYNTEISHCYYYQHFFVNINFIQSSNDSQLTGRIYL